MAHPSREAARVLRRRDVQDRTGLSRSTLYERVAEGSFPQPIHLGGRSVGWLESEVDQWIDDCVARSRTMPTRSSVSENRFAGQEGGAHG